MDGDCLQLICQQEEYMTYQGRIGNFCQQMQVDEKNTDGVRTSYSIPITTVKVETYDIYRQGSNPEKIGVLFIRMVAYLSSQAILMAACIFIHRITPDSQAVQRSLSWNTMYPEVRMQNI